ncbi:hypothetical protein IEQ34_008924 [Dendrobium chrysotoxum]|uniref:Uncharacterized protein n=1 Tax=Dendrobium chrysotoxum TaxID=161865 RepID=A0AAV7GZZ0_DENCH|nr:hypothetical protein IEQ34_008924 [Dendrobium chrysotoxum]
MLTKKCANVLFAGYSKYPKEEINASLAPPILRLGSTLGQVDGNKPSGRLCREENSINPLFFGAAMKKRFTIRFQASSRARTPCSEFPSKSSKLAPPPVEIWLILSASIAFSTSATESPPPMIVVTPYPLRSANFLVVNDLLNPAGQNLRIREDLQA